MPASGDLAQKGGRLAEPKKEGAFREKKFRQKVRYLRRIGQERSIRGKKINKQALLKEFLGQEGLSEKKKGCSHQEAYFG